MTEGIIQKVYKKIAVPLIIEIDDVDVPVIPQTMVDDAFKELITEIKKEWSKRDYLYDEFDYDRLLEKLIGDNQE